MAINWLAVIVAAIVKFVIGGIWYMPLFGRQWRALQGVPEGASPAGLGQALVVGAIGDLVMAYILARFVEHYGVPSFGEGVLVGFMAWLGFVATIMVGQVFYEKRAWGIIYINAGYQLVGLLVMGAILGTWHGAPAPAPAG